MSFRSYPIPALALRWLYVDFNSYFGSVEQQLRPELRGKPIAVVAVELIPPVPLPRAMKLEPLV